jgi:PKD repeat protein
MTQRRGIGGTALAALALTLCTACGAGGPAPSASQAAPGAAGSPPSLPELQQQLRRELARLGVDPARAAAKAPTKGSEVIDLAALPIDPDGSGPQPATGYQLTWTEQLPGDLDENGEVNIADMSKLPGAWQQHVPYDNPLLHDGFPSYPVGDPAFDGDVPAGSAPLADSGAYNWRLARIDADGNGEINLGDITGLAKHYKERLDGYRVYRRKVGAGQFVQLTDPAAPGQPLLVGRSTADNGGPIDTERPVRYKYVDAFAVDGDYEYRVTPVDLQSGTEGPPSLPGFNDGQQVQAVLKADVTQGIAPLTVNFDASESSVPGGTITGYYWDLNGDGVYETSTGATPTVAYTFTTPGVKYVGLGVEASTGATATAQLMVAVTHPPVARLTSPTAAREVPLTLTLDASGSSDQDGEVVRYAWDMDGNGSYELDTGPIGQRQVTYSAPGTYTVGVQVTDDVGASATTAMTFTLTDDYDEVEDNDTPATATPLGTLAPGQSVSGLRGGIGPALYDGDMEDWYAFDVPSGAQASVQLAFKNSDANLDLQLYSLDGVSVIASSATKNDGEQLAGKLLKAGTYYLRVFRAVGPGGSNAKYTLSAACSALTYDEHEPDNTAATAQDLGDISLNLVPAFWGELGQPDSDSDDWYKFSVGFEADFALNLAFYHDQADLELQLYAADGQTLLGDSSSVSDNEHIVSHLTPGTYLVRCYRFGPGSANYDLSILVH